MYIRDMGQSHRPGEGCVGPWRLAHIIKTRRITDGLVQFAQSQTITQQSARLRATFITGILSRSGISPVLGRLSILAVGIVRSPGLQQYKYWHHAAGRLAQLDILTPAYNYPEPFRPCVRL